MRYDVDAVPVHSPQPIPFPSPLSQPEEPAEQLPARRPCISRVLTKHDANEGTHNEYKQENTIGKEKKNPVSREGREKFRTISRYS